MSKRRKIFLLVTIVTIGLLIAFIVGIGEKPPLAIWKNEDGVEYKIMAIGQLYFPTDSERMLTVRYVSKDPTDPQVRQAEFRDIYTMVAQKLKLDGFGSIGLEAIAKPPKTFGITQYSGYRDRKSVVEVQQLAVQETPDNGMQSDPRTSGR